MAALSPWLQAVRTLRRRRSVIVGYHGVEEVAPEHDPENHCLPPGRFRGQLELLLEAGFELVTVARLAELAGGRVPPPGYAALSFDDGMENNRSVVLPLLEEYGVPATVYVVTGLVGQSNPWLDPAARARMMTEEELRELASKGIELGAHTVSHRDLSTLDEAACLEEVGGSCQALERIAGQPTRTFAYPSCRYGEAALAAVERCGLLAAVTCEGRGSWAPYELKRALITARDGMPSFLAKLVDAYQPVRDSAPGRGARLLRRGARRLAGASRRG